MHYSSTTNAILLLTLNLCVYFIYFIAVNTLGGNFFLICRNWPDDLLSFARRGELSRDWRGVSPLHTPPPGVSALCEPGFKPSFHLVVIVVTKSFSTMW